MYMFFGSVGEAEKQNSTFMKDEKITAAEAEFRLRLSL